MILYDLLIEDFSLMDLLQQLLHTLLVVHVLTSAVLFKESFLIAKLHENAFVVCTLRLDLAVQPVVFCLNLTHFLIGQVDSAEDVRLCGGAGSARSYAPYGHTRHTVAVHVHLL